MPDVDQSAIDELLQQAAAGEAAAPPEPKPYAAAPAPAAAWPPELRRLVSIEVPMIVLLAQRQMSLNEVMRLAVGAIIEFNKPADKDLELLVNNKVIAYGQAVKVSENFGLRLNKVGPVRETIQKLGA